MDTPSPDRPRTLRLAPQDGFENDDQFLESIRTRVEEIEAESGTVEDPLNRARRLLIATNLILADAMEPSCTRHVLYLDNFDHSARSRDAEWLNRADELLAKANAALDLAEAHGAVDSISTARSHATVLDAFLKTIRAYLGEGSDPKAKEMLREAASGLSRFLEDRDSRLAAAATFWQAALLDREADADRVLAILDLPLSDPPKDTLPYSFHARLLRCRSLASRGSFSAAFALFLQMEELTTSWLNGREDAENAMRTIALAKWQVLRAWRDQLDATSDGPEREWCQSRMNEIENERLQGEVSVIRLFPAIPRQTGN
jgi:hypothetical protein